MNEDLKACLILLGFLAACAISVISTAYTIDWLLALLQRRSDPPKE